MLSLKPGGFYRSKAGDVWCCFRVFSVGPEHAKATCVAIDLTDHHGQRIEYFFLDGRYDVAGKREHTLVEELDSVAGYL